MALNREHCVAHQMHFTCLDSELKGNSAYVANDQLSINSMLAVDETDVKPDLGPTCKSYLVFLYHQSFTLFYLQLGKKYVYLKGTFSGWGLWWVCN